MANEERPGEQPGMGEEARILRSRMVEPKKGLGQNHDKKQKTQIIALIVLGCIFIYLVVTTFVIGPPKRKPPASPKNTSTSVSSNLVRSDQSLNLVSSAKSTSVKNEKEDDGWGRSPFSLLSDNGKKNGALILQGIVGSGEDAYALIGQKIVKVGDRIDDKKVKKISNGTVVIEKADGEEITLKL